MPMRSELPISNIQLNDRRSAVSDAWTWIAATITNPELGMIALFCAVGLWLTFDFLHFSSDLPALGSLP